MSERFDYPVRMDAAPEGGFVVTLVDFDEGVTQGETEAEALAHAEDLLEEIIAWRMHDNLDVPPPSRPEGHPTASLDARTSAKLSIYRAMREARWSKAELGRRLGWHMPQVMRLFDVRHRTQLEQLEAALAVLGRRMHVRIEERASAS